MKTTYALAALAVILVVGTGYLVLHRPPDIWTGIRADGGQAVTVGIYSDLDACKVKVGKVGGSCGRNCRPMAKV